MHCFDWLMGGTAIALGMAIALGALANARWLLELRRPKWLAETIGRGPTRGILAAIGLACMALGLVILSGWRPPWTR